MKELTHNTLCSESPFVVTEVLCNPRTLYLGIKMKNKQGDTLQLELNNHWSLLDANFYYSWEDNSRGVKIPVDLKGKELISYCGYNNFYGNFFIFTDKIVIFSLTPDNDYPESTWGIIDTPSKGIPSFSGELTPELQRDYLNKFEEHRFPLFPELSSAGLEILSFPERQISGARISKPITDFETNHVLNLHFDNKYGYKSQLILDGVWEYRSYSLVIGSGETGVIFSVLSDILSGLSVEKEISLGGRGRILIFNDGSGIIQAS